jgi:hypothetical protein
MYHYVCSENHVDRYEKRAATVVFLKKKRGGGANSPFMIAYLRCSSSCLVIFRFPFAYTSPPGCLVVSLRTLNIEDWSQYSSCSFSRHEFRLASLVAIGCTNFTGTNWFHKSIDSHTILFGMGCLAITSKLQTLSIPYVSTYYKSTFLHSVQRGAYIPGCCVCLSI